MKKIIKTVALVLLACVLATAVASCGNDSTTSEGKSNMEHIFRGLRADELSLGEYGEDKVYVGPFTFEVGSVYAGFYAAAAGDNAHYEDYKGSSETVDGIVFAIEYWKQVSASLTNPGDDFSGSKQLKGALVWDKATGNFRLEAKVYNGTEDAYYNFSLSNLSIDEYYENGSFSLANRKLEDIDTTAHEADYILAEYVPFVVDGINLCLDELDEIYTAKGYPIGK